MTCPALSKIGRVSISMLRATRCGTTLITTADTARDALTMVQCVTFEIRWHNTLPIYSCSFQPISATRLTQVLDHNLGQGALTCLD